MKNILILLLIITLAAFAFTGCTPPNGTEGEGEGEGETEQRTVLVEAFIAVECSECAKIEPFLEQLAREYNRKEMVLVEIAPWGKEYHTAETYGRFHNWYRLHSVVPQVLFNGLNSHIIGSTGVTLATLKSKIEEQLAITPALKLEASRSTNSSGTVITGKVTNISKNTLTDLVVNGMVFIDRGTTGFRYSVTHIFENQKVAINSLAQDQEKEFAITIDGLSWSAKDDGVIFVQSLADPNKTIHQSLFID